MKKMAIFVGVPLLVVVLFAWGVSLQQGQTLTFYKDTSVACLANGHTQLALHIHPVVTISVDGEQEALPANIGIDAGCMSEIHTHDESGTLHVETITQERFDALSFTDLFVVWGRSLEREGHDVIITVDGVEKAPEEIVFEDGARIDIMYSSQQGV